jgi:hypothetical protein
MKNSKQQIAGVIGIAVLALAGGMAVTNPGQATYEEFAVARLTKVLKEEACQKLGFGLEEQCPEWVDDNQAEIKQFVAQNTQRQNFIIFSLYTTDLSVRSLLPSIPFLSSLPSYHFETVGAFQTFYTYKANVQ